MHQTESESWEHERVGAYDHDPAYDQYNRHTNNHIDDRVK